MNRELKKFFESKSECTGCSACESICPKNCIRMFPDEYGFVYPVINEEECMECFKCIKVCPVKK